MIRKKGLFEIFGAMSSSLSSAVTEKKPALKQLGQITSLDYEVEGRFHLIGKPKSL